MKNWVFTTPSIVDPQHSTATAIPQRVRRAQILSLSLLVLSGVINYLDRGTLAVANRAIAKELGLSLGQMGLLLSAFSWSYALAQLPTGGLVDRVGPPRLLAAGRPLWPLHHAAD